MYTYYCKITRIIDGDTVVAEIDLGLHTVVTRKVRFLGMGAPERNTPEGVKAAEFLATLFTVEKPIIRTKLDRDDKYGRLLGTFYNSPLDNLSINQQMIDAGHAKVM